MTKEEIVLLKSSWTWVLGNQAKAGNFFYKRLFEVAPWIRSLFPKDTNELEKKLLSSITFIVQHLEDYPFLQEKIREMGKRHIAYGAKIVHYPIISQVLIETLKNEMGKEFTDEMEKAWEKALNFINELMISAFKTT